MSNSFVVGNSIFSPVSQSSRPKVIKRKVWKESPGAITLVPPISQEPTSSPTRESYLYLCEILCQSSLNWRRLDFLDLSTGHFVWLNTVWVTSPTVGPEFRLFIPPFSGCLAIPTRMPHVRMLYHTNYGPHCCRTVHHGNFALEHRFSKGFCN